MTRHLAGVVFGVVLLSSGFAIAQAVKVQIDVKPGDTPTVVEQGRGGFLPVAILSTAEFDAMLVDPTTVKVGPTGTEASVARSMTSDVNDDERPDLMMLVPVKEMGISCETKAIRLTGTLMSGAPIEGSEAVTVEGCATR